ncbi:MAG: hypothetical protein RL701_5745 [Pseudomonadota bacterium]|jgi:hypothetical protein
MSGKHFGLVALIATCFIGLGSVRVQAGDDDALGDLDDLPRVHPRQDEAAVDSDETKAELAATDKEAKPETDAAAVSGEADTGRALVIQPFAGFGIATRSFHRPYMGASQRLEASAVPAAEAGLGITIWPDAELSLQIMFVYQSAIGFTVTESPPFALKNELGARSERVSLDIGPRWRIGTVHVSVPIGASMRTLWPEVHTLMTPGYNLIGPHARIELHVLLADTVYVRIAPEAQWIVQIDDDLWKSGLSSQGMALGGEVAVGAQFAKAWSVGVNYRESHALIATTYDMTFTDVERYVTARLTGAF